MRPPVDIFVLGLLMGATIGIGIMGALMRRAEIQRKKRVAAMRRRTHPAYR